MRSGPAGAAAPVPERATRDRILDAAEARFAQVGFGATSLNDVADDVGLRTPSLYKHFESKHALYVAVLERLLDPYVELLETLLRVPESPAHGIENLRTVVDHYLATPNLARLVQHATLAGGDELALLESRWFTPLFAHAAALTPHEGTVPGADAALVVAVFHALLSGTVTLAPLHARLLGRDPMEKATRDAWLALITGLVVELWSSRQQAEPPKSRRSRSPR